MAHKHNIAKAKKILKDGMIRGKKLTSKQRGLFDLIASGKRPRKKGLLTGKHYKR